MSSGLAAFTLVHVILSLAGIATGFVVLFGMFRAKRVTAWTETFLATTLATSVTGFLFPFHKFLPSHAIGLVSLVVLGIAIFALYGRSLAGRWRATYVITAVMAQYLNVFVLVFQLFVKVPALRALAPTQSETPFKVSQLFVLVFFLFAGIFAVRGSRKLQVRAV